MDKSGLWTVDAPDIPQGWARVDCHTHTYFSGDSNTTIYEYFEAFNKSGLTHICVTDHQSIAAYPLLYDLLGSKVICGQEQRVREGEIIGLFLTKKIPPGLNLYEASIAIREQKGLVYVCHPLDAKRMSIDAEALTDAAAKGLIDAIEWCNSKSGSLKQEILEIAQNFNIPLLGGSDSHVAIAIGSSSSAMPWFDSVETFKESIKYARTFGRHYDPHKDWPNNIVPSTAD